LENSEHLPSLSCIAGPDLLVPAGRPGLETRQNNKFLILLWGYDAKRPQLDHFSLSGGRFGVRFGARLFDPDPPGLIQ
jgi:hypothetical protein